MVGERSKGVEAMIARTCGALRSENAGVSSERRVRIPSTDMTKVSRGRLVRSGLVGS